MEIPVCHRSSTPSGKEEWNTKDLHSHLRKNLAATNILHPSVCFYLMKYVGIASKSLLVGRRIELKQRHKKTPLSLYFLVYPSIHASFYCQTPTHVSFSLSLLSTVPEEVDLRFMIHFRWPCCPSCCSQYWPSKLRVSVAPFCALP